MVDSVGVGVFKVHIEVSQYQGDLVGESVEGFYEVGDAIEVFWG